MAETNISFSKIVSTPTPTSWSQAYSAGRVFASFSLSISEPSETVDHLGEMGKELISTFESEFFTLEAKNLETIKGAITSTISKLGSEVTLSLILCYLEENVLYLFAIGGGKAVLKRGDKIGTVLEGDDSNSIKSASGYVQEEDLIVLETKPFLRIISSSTLASALEGKNPEEIAENLAPHVHETSEGGASSVVLMYKKSQVEPVSIPDLDEEKTETETENETEEVVSDEPKEDDNVITIDDVDDEDTIEESEKETEEKVENITTNPGEEVEEIQEEGKKEETTSPFVTEADFAVTRKSQGLSFIKPMLLGITSRIPKDRRRLLAIALGLILIIVIVSFLAMNNLNIGQNEQLFTKVLSEAKSKYDEGQNLKDLNTSLSQDSFKAAKEILVKNEEKFKKNSTQNKELQDLLSKINAEIKNAGSEKISAKEADKSVSQILSAELENSSGLFFSENKNNVIFVDKSGVNQIDKGNGDESLIIKKDWTTIGGIGTFGSNIYVLDKASGVLKFVPSEDTYSKTDYFTSDTPDLKNSVSMTIDGSVYILFKDGGIKKYTRGKEDTFELTGLSKQLSASAKLFTNEDLDNLYVLDSANSRIVVFSKEGQFKTSYSADILKNAKDLDVKEADKKAYVLSSDKIYQIDLK